MNFTNLYIYEESFEDSKDPDKQFLRDEKLYDNFYQNNFNGIS